MEDTLGVGLGVSKNENRDVLILVLMEDTLGDGEGVNLTPIVQDLVTS